MSRSDRINEFHRRQAVRTRIQRSRRRLDRRAERLVDQALITGSWRRYVEAHPGRSVLAAISVGLALGSAQDTAWPHRIGRRLADWAGDAAWLRAFDEIQTWLARRTATEEPDELDDP